MELKKVSNAMGPNAASLLFVVLHLNQIYCFGMVCVVQKYRNLYSLIAFSLQKLLTEQAHLPFDELTCALIF